MVDQVVAQMVKRLPIMRVTRVQSLGQEDLLEKEMATHSSIPWRRQWQPIPVFLPGKSHGGRSLVGYSPWGCKESDTTEVTSLSRQLKSIVMSLKPCYFVVDQQEASQNGHF